MASERELSALGLHLSLLSPSSLIVFFLISYVLELIYSMRDKSKVTK